MKVPISKRLLLCASLVPQDACVADIGCDHGYLGIHLLLNGIAKRVIASDLNRMPLETAKANAEKYGVSDRIDFFCAAGLAAVLPDAVDTIVCAGMGGELMRSILEDATWVRDPRYTLILQPQSIAPEFRRWLCEEGFAIEEEHPVLDDDHMYFAIKARYTGKPVVMEPWQYYVTPQMLRSRSMDVSYYLDHVVSRLSRTVSGMLMAEKPDPQLESLQKILHNIMEMRDQV